MLFVLVMPILIGFFGNISVAINLGILDLLLPRINNLSVNFMFVSCNYMFCASIIDNGINCGWTLYPSLSLVDIPSLDILIFSLHLIYSFT